MGFKKKMLEGTYQKRKKKKADHFCMVTGQKAVQVTLAVNVTTETTTYFLSHLKQ